MCLFMFSYRKHISEQDHCFHPQIVVYSVPTLSGISTAVRALWGWPTPLVFNGDSGQGEARRAKAHALRSVRKPGAVPPPEKRLIQKNDTMLDIFEYIDYRRLLKDLYHEQKAEKPFFSYRYIAQKVGFTSPGFFTNILARKRNISAKTALKFAALFKFNRAQTQYFELLVLFDQAKNHKEKKYYFERILASKRSKLKIVDKQQYEFYSTWYYTAVRELVNVYSFTGDSDDDFRELAKMLAPPVSPAEAKKAIRFLESAGFVAKDDHGVYRQTDPLISTGYEARSVAITNFQLATADLAKEAVDRFERDKRSLSTLTLSLSSEGYSTIMERLKMFHREVLEIAKADRKPDRVYHINFHVFPMSRHQQ
ncbi:MAG: TIGR02147 family protein [Chitinivibrionales bacterium]|nr:TIGR02147 family protein [Chitinivibrionales bacterium]MBD3396106.1 TIGR02147 family protein [Chitinivibrionales bacterium]